MPPLTGALITVNVAVFLVEQMLGSEPFGWFALWPIASGLFMPWQLGSYAFLHGNLTHLLFNLFGIWMFGSELERVWGVRRLGIFFAVSVLAAALLQLLVSAWSDSTAPMIGASGGLFGLLIGFAMLFPNRTITPLLPPIPMPAWLFVTLYGVIELTLGVTGTATGIAHFAHLGGLLGGWLVIRFWRGRFPFGK